MELLFADRLVLVVTDPRTLLMLLLVLWLPVLIVVLGVLAAFVYLGRLVTTESREG